MVISSESNSNRFERDTAEFISWFESHPHARLSSKIHLADLRFRDAGRGVVATTDIPEDEELFAVPRDLLLQINTSDLHSKIGESVAWLDQWPDQWEALILIIIYEYLRDKESPWFPYLQLLPTTFDTLIYWSQNELQELQASTVLRRIAKKKTEQQWCTTIFPVMRKYKHLFPTSTENPEAEEHELLKLAHMAASLIMAYSFDIRDDKAKTKKVKDKAEGKMLAHYPSSDSSSEDNFNAEVPLAKVMVPFADMLNGDAIHSNARLSEDDEHLVMSTTAAIKAGEEVLNDYGDLPNSDLLRKYGYVLESHTPFDVVEIDSYTIHETCADIKAEEAKGNGDGSDDTCNIDYEIRRPPPNAKIEDVEYDDELSYVLTELTIGMDEHRRNDASTALNIKGLPLPYHAAKLFIDSINNRLAQYETSFEQDEEILRKLHLDVPQDQCNTSPQQSLLLPTKTTIEHLSHKKNNKRYQMALHVRKGEKEILRQVERLLREYVTKHSRPLPSEADASAEKRESTTKRKAVNDQGGTSKRWG